ncbi:hypothetical protein MD484_g8391, partial [Candolleomyces efflorescens]
MGSALLQQDVMMLKLSLQWLYGLGTPKLAETLQSGCTLTSTGDFVEGSLTDLSKDPSNPHIKAECKITVNSPEKSKCVTYSVRWEFTQHEAGVYFYINASSSAAASVVLPQDERRRILKEQQSTLRLCLPERGLIESGLRTSLMTAVPVTLVRDRR